MQNWKVNHVRKEANGGTHSHRLAKEAISIMEEQVHMEEGPQYILDIVLVEYQFQALFHQWNDCWNELKKKKNRKEKY